MSIIDLRKKELDEIESHFYCPEGKRGISLAESMGLSNESMISSSIDMLDLEEYDDVLELGHACCSHLGLLLSKAKDISYFGLEISESMKEEAKKINSHLLSSNKVFFDVYDGQYIPFKDCSFNKVFTVNTIYFWASPKAFIDELSRIIKQGGILLISFIHKDFMESLPFVSNRFLLYDDDDILKLISDSNFKILSKIDTTENIKNKSGDLLERRYTILKLCKN